MLRKLMTHQKEALSKFKNSNTLALFMEMRLGKSLVAIRWAKQFPGRKLIIAPLTPLGDWIRELEYEKCSRITPLTLSKNKLLETKDTWSNCGWFLINYEKLLANQWLLNEINWDVIIADESTKFRNPKTQISKLLCKRNYCNRRAILSGLPRPESDLDFFQQFKFINGEFLNYDNYWSFRHKYFHQDWSGFNWVSNPGTKTLIKKEVHLQAYVLTRKQAGIGSKKIYERLEIEMKPEQKKMYKMINKDFAYNEDPKAWTKWAPTKFLWLSRVAGGFSPNIQVTLSERKTETIIELLKEQLKNTKVVIWFRFNKELRFVRRALKNKNIKYKSITAKVKISERIQKSKIFRVSKSINVMLSQIKCAKYGVDWSCADTAIYYSNPYDMEDRVQSEDRIIHPKKKIPILFIDLITKNTIDEDIVSILQDKKIDSKYFLKELMSKTLERKK